MADDGFGRQWIIEKAKEVLESYGGQVTVRQLHYRLVAIGMPNTQQHYKRVVDAMTVARWDGEVEFEDFLDREREVCGSTHAEPTDLDDKIESAKHQVHAWMENYSKNRWENQPKYVEVWIEKKALQGVFERPCLFKRVALFACKGYPSLTALSEARDRFSEAESRGQEPVIIYFGDHDPSGDDIPRSVQDNLARMGVDVTVERVALTKDQVIEWGLPAAPTKSTDSRSAGWDGVGQVELDAVEPDKLKEMVEEAIMLHFDRVKRDELGVQEAEETEVYRAALKEYVENMTFDDDDDDDDQDDDDDDDDGDSFTCDECSEKTDNDIECFDCGTSLCGDCSICSDDDDRVRCQSCDTAHSEKDE